MHVPDDPDDDKSTLGQVMAWCHEAPSHYLNQCWPSFMILYGTILPHWVNSLRSEYTLPPVAEDILERFCHENLVKFHMNVVSACLRVQMTLNQSIFGLRNNLRWIHTCWRCRRVYARVYALVRVHTLHCSYFWSTFLHAYRHAYARTYAQKFKPAELSRQALIFHPIKCLCEGHAQPTNIDAMVILYAYTRVRSYLKFTTHQRGAILALALPSVVHMRVYARWWSQKVWTQL